MDNINLQRNGEKFLSGVVIASADPLSELKHLGIRHIIIAVGDNENRLLLGESAEKQNFELISAIHPSAVIASSAKLGKGIMIGPQAVVGPECQIADFVILNSCAVAEHESVIKTAARLSGKVFCAGLVTVGELALIELGSIISRGCIIGARSVVGANSLVLKDIPPGVLAFGSPALERKKL